MHKKLASDLTSLAHSILQMKNKEDVLELKKKAYEVYEKLSVLAYVEEYINTTPNATESKEDLLEKIAMAEEAKEQISVSPESNTIEKEVVNETSSTDIIEDTVTISQPEEETSSQNNETAGTSSSEITNTLSTSENIENSIIEEDKKEPEVVKEEDTLNITTPKPEIATVVEEITEQPFDELEGLLFGDEKSNEKNDVKDVGERKTPTLEEELEDTLPVDVMANLFEKVEPKKSLNDHFQNTIQIGLNDRIAFVKHLFEGNQSDFNRVISQLNTCKTEKEAKKFINKLVKPDYDWSEKEEYEVRLMEIIERRFA